MKRILRRMRFSSCTRTSFAVIMEKAKNCRWDSPPSTVKTVHWREGGQFDSSGYGVDFISPPTARAAWGKDTEGG